jgi:hypothetical protein
LICRKNKNRFSEFSTAYIYRTLKGATDMAGAPSEELCKCRGKIARQLDNDRILWTL